MNWWKRMLALVEDKYKSPIDVEKFHKDCNQIQMDLAKQTREIPVFRDLPKSRPYTWNPDLDKKQQKVQQEADEQMGLIRAVMAERNHKRTLISNFAIIEDMTNYDCWWFDLTKMLNYVRSAR